MASAVEAWTQSRRRVQCLCPAGYEMWRGTLVGTSMDKARLVWRDPITLAQLPW